MMLEILYQDDNLIVINKPAGIPVHAGSGGGDNLEDYLHDLRFGNRDAPHLAHRLDRDTSGCLILGRTKNALRVLGRLFEQKRIQKTYWAIVDGIPNPKAGRIDAPLVKINNRSDKWHMRVDDTGHPDAQSAITDYRIMGENAGKSWLEMAPKTGRTHQLRVHCAHRGWPIAGDNLYGHGDDTTPLLLHARGLRIPFVQGGDPIIVNAPPPPDMARALAFYGFTPDRI
jgi:RluA family pseudouridine synthase